VEFTGRNYYTWRAPLPRVITSIDFSSRMFCVVASGGGWVVVVSGGTERENAAA